MVTVSELFIIINIKNVNYETKTIVTALLLIESTEFISFEKNVLICGRFPHTKTKKKLINLSIFILLPFFVCVWNEFSFCCFAVR